MKKYILPKRLGDEIALVVFEELSIGVLILTDRKEIDADAYIEIENKRYSVISLHRPPETCGVDESKADLKELQQDFLQALKDCMEKGKIRTLYLARAHKWENSPYSLALPNLEVKDIKTFPKISNVSVIVSN